MGTTSGFTLVELLVSMTVLVLITGLLTQLVSSTSFTILRSTKGMDNTQLSTLALDRIGNSIAGMINSDTGTLIAYKNAAGSDGLAMLTNGRVRSRTGGSANVNVNSFTDIRMSARGFCVINTRAPDLPSSPLIPTLCWGDGTVTWSPTSNAAPVKGEQGDPTTALSQASQDVVTPPSSPNTTGTMLDFTPLSRSIFRFELTFLLSDGTMVSGGNGSTPPRNKYFVANAAFVTPPYLSPSVNSPSAIYPIAFSTVTSDAVNANGQKIYVRAVIVGIASLDTTTQKILSADQLTQLASLQTFPKPANGQTPSQTWNISNRLGTTYQKIVSPNFPSPVLQNIRVTQRYYYVN